MSLLTAESHFNALDKFSNGDFLASSRETDTIYRISHIDGSILWRLGGKKTDFPLHDNARFGAQHLVRKSQPSPHIDSRLRQMHVKRMLMGHLTDPRCYQRHRYGGDPYNIC